MLFVKNLILKSKKSSKLIAKLIILRNNFITRKNKKISNKKRNYICFALREKRLDSVYKKLEKNNIKILFLPRIWLNFTFNLFLNNYKKNSSLQDFWFLNKYKNFPKERADFTRHVFDVLKSLINQLSFFYFL